MRHRAKLFTLIGLGFVLAAACAVPPAGALGSVTVSPNPVTVTSDQELATVTANWSGQPASTLMFIDVCKKTIADPTFNVTFDCSTLSGLTPNGTPSGAGTVQLEVFRGQTPDGESGWGCFAPGDTAPPGIEKFTTCYVRATNNVVTNYLDDTEQAFTFNVSGGVIPESPLTILLPVLGTLVALGGFVFVRRRQVAA